MQREFKNTGVAPLSIVDAYNRCTHKNLSSPTRLKSYQTTSPLGKNLKKAKIIETTL